jgi:hypothetical protein
MELYEEYHDELHSYVRGDSNGGPLRIEDFII